MSTYRVFIASSIVDFSEVRQRLVYFFNLLSGALDATEIEVFICEQARKSIAVGRKQDEFNRHIESSDLFLLLAGSSVGPYTLEEFDVAAECLGEIGAPAIVVACRSEELRLFFSGRAQGSRLEMLDASPDNQETLLCDLLCLLENELGFQVERTARGDLCVGGRRILSVR